MLIARYATLVRRTLDRMSPRLSSKIERTELASCGMLGLIDAIEKFRIDLNVKFETYASVRIQGAILDHLRSLDWIPRALRRQARAFEDALNILEHRLGRTPTDSEVAEQMGMPLPRLQKMMRDLHSGSLVSLESDGGNEVPLREVLADPTGGPESVAIQTDRRVRLARALESLSERERTVVALYYLKDLTLRRIGRIVGLSEAAVSMIHSAAVSRLRALLHEERRVE